MSDLSTKADFSDCLVLVVAAGRGERAGSGLPKQYRSLAGVPVLTHVLRNFLRALPGAGIQVVIHPEDGALYEQAVAEFGEDLLPAVAGGASRQASVHAGLKVFDQIQNENKIVLIHDAARIFASEILLHEIVSLARRNEAVVPGFPIADSLRRVEGDLSQPVDRAGLRAVQTPQAFRLGVLLDAHRRAAESGRGDFTDDATLAEWAGLKVTLATGDPANFKLTTPGDFIMAEALTMARLGDIRTGFGYDVHAFCPGDHVWIGGVKTPHSHGLEGHSDADVGLHALTDAILGAIADGDIGKLFPPSDPQWKGAASHIFLREAVRRVRALGGMIAHLDLTIVCEAPKIGPHRDAMRAEIAKIAGLELSRVAVKATTSEKLGFTGRREGIAAQAVATIRLPFAG